MVALIGSVYGAKCVGEHATDARPAAILNGITNAMRRASWLLGFVSEEMEYPSNEPNVIGDLAIWPWPRAAAQAWQPYQGGSNVCIRERNR